MLTGTPCSQGWPGRASLRQLTWSRPPASAAPGRPAAQPTSGVSPPRRVAAMWCADRRGIHPNRWWTPRTAPLRVRAEHAHQLGTLLTIGGWPQPLGEVARREHVPVMECYSDGGLAKGGTVGLYSDGQPAGRGRVGVTQPMIFSGVETTDVCSDAATPSLTTTRRREGFRRARSAGCGSTSATTRRTPTTTTSPPRSATPSPWPVQ